MVLSRIFNWPFFLHFQEAANIGRIFGIVPMFSAFINGAMLGSFASSALESQTTTELLFIMPHGIFELPAMFIAWGAGIWAGAYLLRKDKDETFENRKIRSLLLSSYVISLLLIAAIIETYTIIT